MQFIRIFWRLCVNSKCRRRLSHTNLTGFRIGTEAVIHRVRELFNGHPDLIVGFNNFIPQDYRLDSAAPRVCVPSTTVRIHPINPTLENVSPTEKFVISTKNSDYLNDWTGSVGVPPVSLNHDVTLRTAGASPGIPVQLTDVTVNRTVNTTPVDPNLNPTSQSVLGPTYQENLPNAVNRTPYATSPNAGHHVFQQQQQAQSFNHALHYVNKIKTETIIGRRLSGQFAPSPDPIPAELSVSVPQVIDRVSVSINMALSNRQKTEPNATNASNQLPNMEGKRLKRLVPTNATIPTSAALVTSCRKARATTRDVSVTDVSHLASGLDISLLHESPSPCEGSGINSYVLDGREKEKCERRSRSPGIEPNNFDTFGPITCSSHPVLSSIGDAAHKRLDLDFTKLRLCGTSYRALPANFPLSRCSGRVKCPIAKEVLNDSYISFSSLTSEDSQFVSSKKNQYEEHMYRVEDERYEVDMVTELNRSAMKHLMVVKRRMDHMATEDLNRFTLGDNLGGTSAILMRKAIHRVYGDKAGDVIYGLRNCPATVVPLVIQRMRQKDSEWREAIRSYQRSWTDQDARNYLRSLDHQGATFKQRDAPLIRSKTMISQIEAIAKDDVPCHNPPDPIGSMISATLTQHCLTTRTDLRTPGTFGSSLINVNEGYKEAGAPHLGLVYPPTTVRNTLLGDAASLIIHHVKRQSNTNKEDKRTMKFLMRTVVQDLFMADRFPMSDDDDDDEDEDEFGQNNDQEDDDDTPTGTVDDVSNNNEGTRTRASRQNRMKRARETKRQDDPYSSVAMDTSSAHDDRLCEPNVGSKHEFPSANCGHVLTEAANGAAYCRVSDRASPPSSNDFLHSDPTGFVPDLPKEEHYSLLYGNNHWYSFLRLHHLLLCRLYLFRFRSLELADQAAREKKSVPVQAAEVLRLRRYGDVDPADYYGRALSLVKDLLDGGEDVNKYEDRLRDMFGIYAFPWFTLDRLVINIVRQLQALASADELSHRLTSLHRSWMWGSATCGSPQPQRFGCGSQSSVNSPYIGVRGPLCTRSCRLPTEAAYRVQSLALIAAFANQGSSTVTVATTGQTNIAACPPTNGASNAPNCFAIIVLNEASVMLLRLVSPRTTPDMCDTAAGGQYECSTYRDSCAPNSTTISLNTTSMSSLSHSNKRWFDYLHAHLVWTLGYVPPNVASRIRPVFLYRNVRQCVRALTRSACQRRKQELVDTGDTQPEELLLEAARVEESNPNNSQEPTTTITPPAERPETPEGITDDKVPETTCSTERTESVTSSVNFERDAWEFMCHVFKSDLTRRELFRDTYSSDCMQSTDRLLGKPNPKTHKINWSVGSYGVFIRRKTLTETNDPAVYKWRNFHDNWLQEHANPLTLNEVSNQMSRGDIQMHHSTTDAVDDTDAASVDTCMAEEKTASGCDPSPPIGPAVAQSELTAEQCDALKPVDIEMTTEPSMMATNDSGSVTHIEDPSSC